MTKPRPAYPTRALITGSSGLIGSALCAKLREHDCEVIELSHRKREGALRWSPEDGELPDDALEGVDAVFHLAGENVAARWSPSKKQSILKSRVQGTQLISEKIASLPDGKRPQVFVSASAIGFYGINREGVMDESSESGGSFLSQVCEQWEGAAQKAREAGVRVVHPRISAVLSPDGGVLERLLPIFRKGGGGVVGSGKQRMSWISLPDVVSALIHCVSYADMEGAVNLAAPQVVTNRQFTKTLAQALGKPTVLPVPAFVVKLLYGEMAEETVLNDLAVAPRKLIQTGLVFQHETLEVALQNILD